MGGNKLEITPKAATSQDIEATLNTSQHSFSDDSVVINGSSYQYRECASSCIGFGSFGCVFRGTEKNTGKRVAIKRVACLNPRSNELKVMKEVRSRFLVNLIDVFAQDNADENIFYIIMELCDTDLDQHLRSCFNMPLKLDDLKVLVDNVARGYKALYDNQIVHRDIKPQNILIKYSPHDDPRFETVKISDFGISRILSDEENRELSNVAGTFSYMAPEVGANLIAICEYDYEVDIWSLGIVFYQCITGRVPFDECDLCKIFLYTATGNYEAFDKPELPKGTDEGIRYLIHSMLEIDRDQRMNPLQFYTAVCSNANNKTVLSTIGSLPKMNCHNSNSTTRDRTSKTDTIPCL